MTLLGTSTSLKTFDMDNSGYLMPNPGSEAMLEQANVTGAENSYMNMNKNSTIHNQPPIKEEGYIEISNAKRQVPARNNFDAVRYSKSPGRNAQEDDRRKTTTGRRPPEDDHQNETDYTEIFFQKSLFSDREPIFNEKHSNTKLVSINVLLFVLILLLAVPIVYLFVVIQGQNRTLVIYEGKIKLLDEKLQTLIAHAQKWERGCCNSSMDLRTLNASLDALAEFSFAKLDVNSNVIPSESRTALHVAAKEGQQDKIKFLISHGANIEAKDMSGFTPLHLAALYRHDAAVNLLLDEGAAIDGVNVLNKTALFFAIRNDCLSCVKTLLERGADVHHRDNQSVAPLDFANQNHHREIAEFIRGFMEQNTTKRLL